MATTEPRAAGPAIDTEDRAQREAALEVPNPQTPDQPIVPDAPVTPAVPDPGPEQPDTPSGPTAPEPNDPNPAKPDGPEVTPPAE